MIAESVRSEIPRVIFGGDRPIAVRVLRFLLESGCVPNGLLLADPTLGSHNVELAHLFRNAGGARILSGREAVSPEAADTIRELQPDYIILVHLQAKIPQRILDVPTHGVVNLHPAYLPYNRGWHTPTWAILRDSAFGATLHFMSEGIDEGDIVHQRRLAISPEDTAHTLYQKALDLEFEVFREAWPALATRTYVRTPQVLNEGTAHKKRDLEDSGLQRLDLEEVCTVGDLIDRLRALTTNQVDEACYFEKGGERYRLQVSIVPDRQAPR